MKKTNKIFAALLVTLPLAFTSCSDVLDQAPDGKMDLSEVWVDNDKVGAYLNTATRTSRCTMTNISSGHACR